MAATVHLTVDRAWAKDTFNSASSLLSAQYGWLRLGFSSCAEKKPENLGLKAKIKKNLLEPGSQQRSWHCTGYGEHTAANSHNICGLGKVTGRF